MSISNQKYDFWCCMVWLVALCSGANVALFLGFFFSTYVGTSAKNDQMLSLYSAWGSGLQFLVGHHEYGLHSVKAS